LRLLILREGSHSLPHRRSKISSSLRCALAIPAALLGCPLVAHAQVVVAPSQVTPQTLRPAPTNAPVGLTVPGAEALQAPAGAERSNIIVRRFAIEGGFPELEGETRALAQPLEGRRITAAQIYEFANALEQAYARAGYVLVRVTVPPQKLSDRRDVRIVVIDGFIERVEVDNVAERVRALVAARTASLVGRRHITLAEIERSLLIAGDAPGLRLKSTLARGATPGGALLVLEGTDQPVTGAVTIDNHLPTALGTWSYGADLAVNSPFGFGEQFYASALTSADISTPNMNSPLWVVGGGAVIPLGLDGWTLNPEYTNSRSQPTPGTSALANTGRFQRVALRTSYPLIRTRSETLTLTGAYEYIIQNVYLPVFATDLNSDRYSALRAGAVYEAGLPWLGEALQASAVFSHGVGGRGAADVSVSGIPLSRLGASPYFSKITADARLSQPLPESFRLDLIGRGQTSFGQPVLQPEQFQLDGPLAVSGYPIGTLNVDEGVSLRGELGRPFVIAGAATVPVVVTPYAFGATGVGRLLDPTVLEVGTIHAGSFGAGLRSGFDLPNGYQGATLGLEAARQYSNLATVGHGWRFNGVLSLHF